jgi:dynactin-4
MPEYRSRVEIGASGMAGDAEFIKHIEDVGEVAGLEQRWINSWKSSLQTRYVWVRLAFGVCLLIDFIYSDLKPLRIPLHSKVSKRCPTCTHILIKPEQKAQSVRYKIKLVAANYLPAITVALPHMQTQDATKRTVAKSTPDEVKGASTTMYAGKTYAFHLALTNPLYDPIQVRLSVQRMHVAVSSDGTVPEKARRPPFAVSLPTSSFTVAAFAEAWEYEDDEDMFGVEDDELGLESPRKSGKDKDGRGKTKTVGVLEKKANLTVVGGEVVIGKEARGNVKV